MHLSLIHRKSCDASKVSATPAAAPMMHLALELGVQRRGSCQFFFILVGMPFFNARNLEKNQPEKETKEPIF